MPQTHAGSAHEGARPHDARTRTTLALVTRFNDAFNRHDVDAAVALMTDDCLFENTYPPPDGERFQGKEAVRACWAELMRSTPAAHFETEEMFAMGDRCIVRWRYTFGTGHVRGVDIFRIRQGEIAEKRSYVKG
jgi:ketosteroid isomerase-like protein